MKKPPAVGRRVPKKIRDPIHRDIHVDDAALELLDTPKFQRLRRVRQLGTASLVYPGANHTRFEHSLGAYHLASLACRALGLAEGDALDLRCAALLHDVGHGPFSHLTDLVMIDTMGKGHVEVTRDAVRSGTIRDALERHGADPARVADLIGGAGHLGNLVSGDLDCDRMDYLVRDSHYTGVAIGVDLDRLVGETALTPDGIVLKEGGQQAAEMLLLTRFMMYSTVYYHHASRVGETMVDRAIRLAIEGGEIQPHQLPAMDDYALVHLLRQSKTDAWRFMMAVDQRKLLKVAHEARLDDVGADRAAALATDRSAARDDEAAIAAEAGVRAVDVIVDAPPVPRATDAGVRLQTASGALVPLAERSSLVASLAGAEREAWRLRVLAPAAARDRVAAAAIRRLGPVTK